jgi:CRP-like cAMP-binding protein
MTDIPINIEMLSGVCLFSGLDPDMLSAASEYMETTHFKTGDTILKEGETGDELLILASGRVEICQTLVMRSEEQDFEEKDKTLIVLDADTLPVFGEMGLLESSPRTATVRALSDCLTWTIQRDRFIEFCFKHQKAGVIAMKNLAALISKRLRKANKDVLKLTTALSIVLKH